ncbi:hypothetical protein PAN31117_01904 [Pandoraea anapnoica]|uniref:Uncharacterized protein n=1 Tax=Pandoraea anapnoica TaxID=2508301 RepID=A0A5E4ZW03_9BURK|nr:hypothetical protein [Pandoraea anapnoica]VVE65539.1 hypothetical protein PAN31117_01904 [Pandoraea anapnoica]
MNAREDFPPGAGASASSADAAAPRFLDPPSVLQADPPFLDPADTTPGGATVEVPVYWDQAAGDMVRINWQGIDADGNPRSYNDEQWLSGSGVGKPMYFTVPQVNVELLAGGTVTLTYTVTYFSGLPVQTSYMLELSVVAKDEVDPNLPLPLVDRVANGKLDPDADPGGTVARIPSDVTRANDIVHIVWTGTSSFTDWIPISAAMAGMEVPFQIARNLIEENRNGLVSVRYEIERNNRRLASRNLIFVVGELQNLPTPKLKDIEGDELDLDDVENGGVVQVVPPWPFIAEGQRFWLDLEGTDEDGTPRKLRQANGVVVNPQHVQIGLTNRQVPASFFASLGDGTELRIIFKVTFDHSLDEANAITFPERTFRIISAPDTFTEDFETAPLGIIPVGTSLELQRMTLTAVSASAAIGANGSAYAPQIGMQYVGLSRNATVRMELKTPMRTVRFGIADSDRIPSHVRYLDKDSVLIHSHATPSYGSADRVWSQYTAQQPNIKYIEITDGGGDSFIDNFTFTR